VRQNCGVPKGLLAQTLKSHSNKFPIGRRPDGGRMIERQSQAAGFSGGSNGNRPGKGESEFCEEEKKK